MQKPESSPPTRMPTGLQLGAAARVVGRAFDDALEQAGGSLPVWLILLNLKIGRPGTQRELAQAVGLREATLTHHLNALDKRGLVARRRDPENRRIHVVTLTEAGEQAFLRMREAATAFDEQLNDGLTDVERALLADLLRRLAANVDPDTAEAAGAGAAGAGAPGAERQAAPPWAGLAERPARG